MSVYDIKSREDWQEILDGVSSRLGMPAAILDEQNVILQHSGTRNPLCRRIREQQESKSLICGQSQQFMAGQAWNTGEPVIEACEAGLIKLVLPLFHRGERAGTLTACGSCGGNRDMEDFLIQKSTGLSDEELCALQEDVADVDSDTLRSLARELHERIQAG